MRREENVRALVVRLADAVEAVCDGDRAVALGIVDTIRAELNKSAIECGRCGRRFRWPGELDAHLVRDHSAVT